MFFKNINNYVDDLLDHQVKQYLTHDLIIQLSDFLNNLDLSEIHFLLSQKSSLSLKEFVSLLNILVKAQNFKK